MILQQRTPRALRFALIAACAAVISAHAARVAKPTFGKSHGFFTSSISVKITSSTSTAQIRYTTDGSAPTASHGVQLANGGSVTVNKTTVLRAVGYQSGMTTSYPFTQTYIFLSDVIVQGTPPGYNTDWGPAGTVGWYNGSSDYGMDPQVVNDSRYSSTIKGDLKAIPTLSLVADKDDLFAASAGLYVTGGSGANTKEIAVSAELIWPDGRAGFQIDAGLKSHTHRCWKRSLRLLFKTNYGGPQKLEYDFFQDAPLHAGSALDSLGKLILRAGMNEDWGGMTKADQAATTYIKDQFMRDSQIDMCGYGAHGTFVHLYINGYYWGVYNPVERPDARWAADTFGGAKTDYYARNHAGNVSGSSSRYTTYRDSQVVKDQSNTGNYTTTKNYLNVQNYCDYVLLGWYGATDDWVKGTGSYQNNFYVGNRNSPAGPVHYYVWDAELSFRADPLIHPGFLQLTSHKDLARPFYYLWRSPDFRVLLADRLYKHLKNGGALSSATARARWDALHDHVERAIVGESARWGDCRKDHIDSGLPVYTRHAHWYSACTAVRNQLSARPDQLLNVCRAKSLRGFPIYPSLNPPLYNKHGGSVAAGYRLTITRNNGSGTIFYRADGADPRVDGGAVRSGSSSGTGTQVLTLNSTSTVKARVKNGSTWSALANATFTVSGPALPAAPGGLAASATSTTQIALTWSDNSNNENGFKIDRRQSGTSGTGAWVRIATLAAGTTTHTDSGLPADTKFYYKVKAWNASGNSAYSPPVCATTDPDGPKVRLFTAYNDLHWAAAQPAANITVYSTTNGNGTATDAGALVDYETGATAEVSLSVAGGNRLDTHATQGANADSGTDADAVFAGKLDAVGLVAYGASPALTLAFAGLDPDTRYELVLFGNRAGGYADRLTTATISGVAGFGNRSTSGADFAGSADSSVTICNGENTANGYVARFTDIQPAAGQDMVITVDSPSAQYYANALMLRAYEPQLSGALVPKGATWTYHAGTTDASAPPGVWRRARFDDSDWDVGPAPFGYGDGPYGTTLDQMRDNYTCLFLRKAFTIAGPARVSAVNLWTLYDDGFVVWINGKDVARHNVAGTPGTTPSFDATANDAVADGTEWSASLTGASLPVLARTNMLAIQVFNADLASSDLTLDAELSVEYGTPPGTDTDDDGLPDDWEQAYLSDLSDPSDLSDSGDPDNDGASNIEEWIAGTDPDDETGYLKLETRLEQGQVTASFQAVPAEGSGYAGLTRHYGLQTRAAPGQDAWTDVAGGYADLTATAAETIVYTVPDADTTAQFRVKVWLE